MRILVWDTFTDPKIAKKARQANGDGTLTVRAQNTFHAAGDTDYKGGATNTNTAITFSFF
jgi:hypothetical protein